MSLSSRASRARSSSGSSLRILPLAASFTDIPTTHQFFREIEAVRGASITGGCTSTQYCSDLPVTRGQMAAFLARALGL